jgi:hypothetical protein
MGSQGTDNIILLLLRRDVFQPSLASLETLWFPRLERRSKVGSKRVTGTHHAMASVGCRNLCQRYSIMQRNTICLTRGNTYCDRHLGFSFVFSMQMHRSASMLLITGTTIDKYDPTSSKGHPLNVRLQKCKWVLQSIAGCRAACLTPMQVDTEGGGPRLHCHPENPIQGRESVDTADRCCYLCKGLGLHSTFLHLLT